MSCPFEIDVVRWVTGDTRLNELASVEQHVSECASCRGKAESLRSILNRIADPPMQVDTNESSPKVFVDSVMEKIGKDDAPRRISRSTKRVALAVGFAIPVALAGWTAHRLTRSDGAHPPAAHARVAPMQGDAGLFVARDGELKPAGETAIRATDELVMRYENPTNSVHYLLAFTLRPDGKARWLDPAQTGTEGKASSIALRPQSSGQVGVGSVRLESAIRAPFRIVAIVSDDPTIASSIQASLAWHPPETPIRELAQDAIVREWRLSWEDAPSSQTPQR